MKASVLVAFLIFVQFIDLFATDSRIATQDITLQVAGSALLAIGGPAVVLKMAGATEAGDSITQQTENSNTRLRISSLVNADERRSITAKISDALVGTQLFVDFLTPNDNFFNKNQMGVLKGLQLLSNESETTLVESIGTCWSGKGEGDGYIIKYVYRAEPGSSILRGGNITITYTITLVPSDNKE